MLAADDEHMMAGGTSCANEKTTTPRGSATATKTALHPPPSPPLSPGRSAPVAFSSRGDISCNSSFDYSHGGHGSPARSHTCSPQAHVHPHRLASSSPHYPLSGHHLDPYKTLSVRRDATAAEITAAYRRLSLLHHPSRSPRDNTKANGSRPSPTAAAAVVETSRQDLFIAISASYQTLIHPTYRRRYDVTTRSKSHTHEETGRQYYPAASAVVGGEGDLLMHHHQIHAGMDRGQTMPPFGEVSDGGCDGDEAQGTQLTATMSASGSSSEGAKVLHANAMSDGSAFSPADHDIDGRSSLDVKPSHSLGGDSDYDIGAEALDAFRLAPSSSNARFVALQPEERMRLQQQGRDRTQQRRQNDVSEDGEKSYSSGQSNHIFRGPLAPLYRARNYLPFEDPFLLFRKIMGSAVFHPEGNSNNEDIIGTSENSSTSRYIDDPLDDSAVADLSGFLSLSHIPQLPVASKATMVTATSVPISDSLTAGRTDAVSTPTEPRVTKEQVAKKDQRSPLSPFRHQKTIKRTERIVNGKRMVRTETTVVDPKTGKSRTTVEVTKEDLELFGDNGSGGKKVKSDVDADPTGLDKVSPKKRKLNDIGLNGHPQNAREDTNEPVLEKVSRQITEFFTCCGGPTSCFEFD